VAMLADVFVAFVPYLALVIRVVVGLSLMVHGYPKLRGEGKKQSIAFMKSVGIPGTAAVLAGLLEFFGGFFLVIGFIVPVVACLFILQFASIVLMKKNRMKLGYIIPGKPNYEIDVTYLLLALVLLVVGAGVLSLDSLMPV